MKAERRHELRENDLAHMLDSATDYFRNHGARLAFAVVGVLVVLAVVGITVRSRAAALEDAWQRKRSLSFANLEDGRRSLDTLSSLTESSGDRSFVFGALIDQGHYALALAQQVESPPDPDLNETARSAFVQLIAQFPENPMAFGAAHCGLATVEENAFSLDGDSDHKPRAMEHLQAVIDKPELAGMPFYRMATERMKHIDRIFTMTRFAAALVVTDDETGEETQPPSTNLTPISQDQVPTKILQKVKVRDDGTLEVLEEKQE